MIYTDINELLYQYDELITLRKRYEKADLSFKKSLALVGKNKKEELNSLINIYKNELKKEDPDEFVHLVIDVLFVV